MLAVQIRSSAAESSSSRRLLLDCGNLPHPREFLRRDARMLRVKRGFAKIALLAIAVSAHLASLQEARAQGATVTPARPGRSRGGQASGTAVPSASEQPQAGRMDQGKSNAGLWGYKEVPTDSSWRLIPGVDQNVLEAQYKRQTLRVRNLTQSRVRVFLKLRYFNDPTDRNWDPRDETLNLEPGQQFSEDPNPDATGTYLEVDFLGLLLAGAFPAADSPVRQLNEQYLKTAANAVTARLLGAFFSKSRGNSGELNSDFALAAKELRRAANREEAAFILDNLPALARKVESGYVASPGERAGFTGFAEQWMRDWQGRLDSFGPALTAQSPPLGPAVRQGTFSGQPGQPTAPTQTPPQQPVATVKPVPQVVAPAPPQRVFESLTELVEAGTPDAAAKQPSPASDQPNDLDDFHRRTMERLQQNQQFYQQNPGYTGPPPGNPIPVSEPPRRVFDSLSSLLDDSSRAAPPGSGLSQYAGLDGGNSGESRPGSAASGAAARGQTTRQSEASALASDLFDSPTDRSGTAGSRASSTVPAEYAGYARETTSVLADELFGQVQRGEAVDIRAAARTGIEAKLTEMKTATLNAVDDGLRSIIQRLPDHPSFDPAIYYNTFLSPQTRVLTPWQAKENIRAYYDKMAGQPLDDFLEIRAAE